MRSDDIKVRPTRHGLYVTQLQEDTFGVLISKGGQYSVEIGALWKKCPFIIFSNDGIEAFDPKTLYNQQTICFGPGKAHFFHTF